MKHPLVDRLRTQQTAALSAVITALKHPQTKGAEPTMSEDQRGSASTLLRGMYFLLGVDNELVLQLENASTMARTRPLEIDLIDAAKAAR